jgi:hypothetical protein
MSATTWNNVTYSGLLEEGYSTYRYVHDANDNGLFYFSLYSCMNTKNVVHLTIKLQKIMFLYIL